MGSKGKGRVSENPSNEAGSSGELQGGSTADSDGAVDGANGHDNNRSDSGDGGVVNITVDEAVDVEDSDSVVEHDKFANDTLAGSPSLPTVQPINGNLEREGTASRVFWTTAGGDGIEDGAEGHHRMATSST